MRRVDFKVNKLGSSVCGKPSTDQVTKLTHTCAI